MLILIKTAAANISAISNYLRGIGQTLTTPCEVWKDFLTKPRYHTNPHVSHPNAPFQYVSSAEPPVAPPAAPILHALAMPRAQATKRTEPACSFLNDITAYMHIAVEVTIKKEAKSSKAKKKDVPANVLNSLETQAEDEEVLECKFSAGSSCRS